MDFLDNGSRRGERSITHQLKAKSRRRREGLERLRASAPAHAPRNDPLPNLDLVYVPIEDLRMPSRVIRKLEAAHVHEVASAISTLGFCAPVLIGKDNAVIEGAIRLHAARHLGLGRVPCVRIEHLSEVEQRILRVAINRLGEKGEWNLDELKVEFEELIFADAPIEVSGFTLDEIDHIVLGEAGDTIEEGPLSPESGAIAVARIGDVFDLGPHRIICGSATDSETLRRLMESDASARLVLTDEPYNVPIAGHVTGGQHREFAMASGEMTDAEFLAFNEAWMAAVLPCLCDGGVFGSFIDWRGYPTVHSAALKLGLKPLNLVVWTKTNAGMGSLYRSQHELLPLFKNGSAPHVNTLFDLFLLLDRKQQKEFYALVIGAFMPTTPPVPEPQPRGAPERQPEELLNVQRKLLETELVVALDGATKDAWGLTRDGWTAVQMLLGVAAAADSELPPFEADPIPEPELDRSAPWTFPLPAPGKLDVAALVKPLLGARAAA